MAAQVLGCNRQIYALKRVRLANKDPEAIRGFIDEITLLKQLRNTANIIQLISAQVSTRVCAWGWSDPIMCPLI
jgi:serine/threonine-protein kinase TTK/MPS1